MKDNENQRYLYAFVNTVLECSLKKIGPITHLKLQKLLYLCYGAIIRQGNEELNFLQFEAWQFGPVLTEVYHYYKNPLSNEIKNSMNYNGAKENITNYKIIKAINDAIEQYGKLDEVELINETHKEGGAWNETKKNCIIDLNNIKKEFV